MGRKGVKRAGLLQHLAPDERMQFYNLKFFAGERSRLIQNVLGDRDLADIVETGPDANDFRRFRG